MNYMKKRNQPYAWLVGTCLKISGSRPAFYYPEGNGYRVMLLEEPWTWKRMTSKDFHAAFATTWPDGNEKVRKLFKEIPTYREWVNEMEKLKPGELYLKKKEWRLGSAKNE